MCNNSTDDHLLYRCALSRRFRAVALTLRAGLHSQPLMSEPPAEYRARLELRRGSLQRLEKLDSVVAMLRLAAVGAFLLVAWLIWASRVLPTWTLLLPVAAFFCLAVYHDRLFRIRRRVRRAIRFYEEGLARIEDRWIGTGRSDFVFNDESHLYAPDLDIFGKGSLFGLLCTARTSAGEETLAAWLCSPAAKDEILQRQQAIDELRHNLDLREDLAVLGDDVRSAIRPELTRWSNAPTTLNSTSARLTALGLAVLNTASVITYLAAGAALPMLVILPVSIVFARVQRRRVLSVLGVTEEPQRELKVLGLALARLEREHFQSPKLAGLRAALQAGQRSASSEIRRFLRLSVLVDSQRNQFFRPISYFLMWATQLAYAIENWRRKHGPEVSRWLAAVGELEALCALAGFAYEHPNDPFPEIVETGPVLDAEELRHPLLPPGQCVPNSLKFDGELQLFVVSGSNMSGKSTLLRTVGTNVALALAGAPVRARRLRLSPLNIGATLRIQDSLQTGTSRFYAEIQRLRQIVDRTAGSLPVLFLLDEILHGTNSHDRAIGAEAIMRGLIDHGAIGLVTTHDLALARAAEALAPRAVNVHFEDHLENGKMMFDYRLRPGVVQKSNALELMRAVGLKV